nr:MAG TPA: hypothetical protein [Caudoviricetes sp.]
MRPGVLRLVVGTDQPMHTAGSDEVQMACEGSAGIVLTRHSRASSARRRASAAVAVAVAVVAVAVLMALVYDSIRGDASQWPWRLGA